MIELTVLYKLSFIILPFLSLILSWISSISPFFRPVNSNLLTRGRSIISISKVQRTKKQFTLEVYGQDQTTLKYTTLLASPVTLDTSFLIEMKNQFRDWQANGAELTFNLLDMWNLKFRDENI